MNTAPLDSLRKISIPCAWGKNETIVTPAWSTDSVIYRAAGFADEKPIRIKGGVTYALAGNSRPEFYTLKLYGQNSDNEISLPYPENILWAGIIPPRPMTRRFRFGEKGGFLGMAGGLGVSKFVNDRFTASNSGTDYMPDLMLGLLYYSPSAVYQASFELNGVDSSGRVPSLSTASPLGVRYYPFSRSSQGFSFHGASEFTFFEAQVGGQKIEDNEFGAEVGVGYDTDFDRLTYSYHTAQGGYHEVELLIGITALQQGKAGLKASVLTGDKIKFATIQAYMENRLDFETMIFRNPRSLRARVAALAGLIGLWFIVQ
ncbi:MAG: hypothetical protein JSV52_08300 [Candidatus Zixiibacteriota bacterium]|nr:MAG: hypothetical protein JSV52_08300 [candidate division Zixibacteria bacterium]